MIMHVKLKAYGVATLTFRFNSPPPITVLDAIRNDRRIPFRILWVPWCVLHNHTKRIS